MPSGETNLPGNETSEIVRFVGLDTSEPIAQIGGLTDDINDSGAATFFSGHYENTLGTSTFFAFQEPNSGEEGMW